MKKVGILILKILSRVLILLGTPLLFGWASALIGFALVSVGTVTMRRVNGENEQAAWFWSIPSFLIFVLIIIGMLINVLEKLYYFIF